MERKEKCKEKCEFTVHPCNFKIEINEVKAFYVSSCKVLLLDLKIINKCNINSRIKIKSKPKHGKIYLLGTSIIMYKSFKNFYGFDIFEILVEDECGGTSTENILVHVV